MQVQLEMSAGQWQRWLKEPISSRCWLRRAKGKNEHHDPLSAPSITWLFAELLVSNYSSVFHVNYSGAREEEDASTQQKVKRVRHSILKRRWEKLSALLLLSAHCAQCSEILIPHCTHRRLGPVLVNNWLHNMFARWYSDVIKKQENFKIHFFLIVQCECVKGVS